MLVHTDLTARDDFRYRRTMPGLSAKDIYLRLSQGCRSVAEDLESGRIEIQKLCAFYAPGSKQSLAVVTAKPGCALGHVIARAVGAPKLVAGNKERSPYRALEFALVNQNVDLRVRARVLLQFRDDLVQDLVRANDNPWTDDLRPVVAALTSLSDRFRDIAAVIN